MLVAITLLIEIISTIVCIHRVYGKNVSWDVQTISLALLLLFLLETINKAEICKIFTVFVYVILGVYCKLKFREPVIRTVIFIIIMLCVMTILQFVCLLCVDILIPENEMIRSICVNTAVLCCNIFLLPRCKLDVYRYRIKIETKYIILVLSFVVTIVLFLLLQGKMFGGVRADIFVLLIPAIMILVVLFLSLNKSQTTIEQMKADKVNNKQLQKRYDEILKDVRIKQHEFKNHLAAIFSSHYTYKTYEQLVQAQKEYSKKLIMENKYNNLLQIQDKVLAAFLYDKFLEIENDDLNLEYKIGSSVEEIAMPTYHIIEMFGILIDNEVEAAKKESLQNIYIEMVETGQTIHFIIRNICVHMSYNEIEQWFQMGTSSKGINRGIGLYHVKELCEEWNCNIFCENIEIEGRNWIQFDLEMCKEVNH